MKGWRLTSFSSTPIFCGVGGCCCCWGGRGWTEPAELNQGSGWLYGRARRQGGGEGQQDCTKMAAKLHFSGDRSSILGMKVSADVTNWGTWMTTKRSWPPSLPRWTKTFSIPYKQNKLLLLYSCVLFNNQSCEHMFRHSPIKFFGLPAFWSSQMSLVLLP